MRIENSNKYVQFVKYCLVGVLNTLVTFGVIYICKSFLDLNLYVSNALGYIAGVVNSFVCNKQWVFQSKGGYRREALIFVMGFLICYGIQLWVSMDYHRLLVRLRNLPAHSGHSHLRLRHRHPHRQRSLHPRQLPLQQTRNVQITLKVIRL